MSNPLAIKAGRLAQVPTVWSNCLAGWWLGGGGNGSELPFMFAGATLLYAGGGWLRDIFDPEHGQGPVWSQATPAGVITSRAAWRWALGFLVAGALLLFVPGETTGRLGLVLVCLLVAHNTVTRLIRFGPIVSGASRCLLYVLGASIAVRGITGWAIWCGLALGIYVAGADYFARQEKPVPGHERWPLVLLSVPILLALLMDTGRYREPALLLSAVLLLWLARSLRQGIWSSNPDHGRGVSGLRTGMIIVDWLATCPVASVVGDSNHAPRELSLVFIGLILGKEALGRVFPER